MTHYEFERRLIVGKKQNPYLDIEISTLSSCKRIRPYTRVWVNIYSTLPAPYSYKIYKGDNLVQEDEVKKVTQWYPWHEPPLFLASIIIKPKKVGRYKVAVTKDTLTKEGEFEVYGPFRPIIRPPATVRRPIISITNIGDLRGFKVMKYQFYKRYSGGAEKILESGEAKSVRYARLKVPGEPGETIYYMFILPYECEENGRTEYSIIDGKVVLATLRDQLKPSETTKVSEEKFTIDVEGADKTNTIIEGIHKITVTSHTSVEAKYWRLYAFVSPFGGSPYNELVAEGKGTINEGDILWSGDYRFDPSYVNLYLTMEV